MGWILIKTLTYSTPRRRPDLFPCRRFFRRSHGHFGLGDPKGLESHGRPLGTSQLPIPIWQPPQLQGSMEMHKKTFRKSCCCCWTGMPGNLLNSEYIDIFEVPDQYSTIFYSCTWMRPTSFCKIHLHELELGINLDIYCTYLWQKIQREKPLQDQFPWMPTTYLVPHKIYTNLFRIFTFATRKLLGGWWKMMGRWCCVVWCYLFNSEIESDG